MSKPKLYLGTIFIDRGAHPAFYISLATFTHANSCTLTMSQLGNGDGALRQLNRRCGEFLEKSKADYFWLQGNDTDFKPHYIERMARSGLPIIGGLFPIKQPELRWCLQSKDGCEPDGKTGIWEVRANGLECLMIHRDVLVAMRKARPDLDYKDNFGKGHQDRQHHYWRWELRPDPGEDGSQILQSEDYLFCEEAAALGFKTHVDTTSYCGHFDGRTRYPLKAPPSVKLEAQKADEPTKEAKAA